MTPPTSPPPDVLAEDRLLSEFWLNRGVDRAALRRLLADLPSGANGDYLVGNAFYGCFEEDLRALVRSEAETARVPESLLRAVRLAFEKPVVRVTPSGPEGRLLAALSTRPSLGSPGARKAQEAAASVAAWPAFLRAACRSNLVPAAVASTEACGIVETIPAAERSVLRGAASGIRARNTRLLDLLGRVLDALGGAGLSPVLIKESALILDVYGDEGDRMVGDIDVLFPPGEAEEADRILRALGFAPFEGIWTRAWYREHHHHLAPLVSPAEAVKIEPHVGIWIPAGPSAPIIPEMIAASRPHRVLKARRPSATHVLFHLLVDLHGNASIGKLGQMADILALLRAEGRDVETAALADLARRTGARPFLEDSIDLIVRTHGATPLEQTAPGLLEVRPRKRPAAERRLARRLAYRNLCGFEPRASVTSLSGARLLHRALIRPGGRAARLRFLVRGAFGVGEREEGVGAVSRRAQAPPFTRLVRTATSPVRFALRAIRSIGRRA